jgi:hypothetical protein
MGVVADVVASALTRLAVAAVSGRSSVRMEAAYVVVVAREGDVDVLRRLSRDHGEKPSDAPTENTARSAGWRRIVDNGARSPFRKRAGLQLRLPSLRTCSSPTRRSSDSFSPAKQLCPRAPSTLLLRTTCRGASEDCCSATKPALWCEPPGAELAAHSGELQALASASGASRRSVARPVRVPAYRLLRSGDGAGWLGMGGQTGNGRGAPGGGA